MQVQAHCILEALSCERPYELPSRGCEGLLKRLHRLHICTLLAVVKSFTKMSVCVYSDGLVSLKHSEGLAISGWHCHGAIGD